MSSYISSSKHLVWLPFARNHVRSADVTRRTTDVQAMAGRPSKVRKLQEIDDNPDGRLAQLQRVVNIRGTSNRALQDILTPMGHRAGTRTLRDAGQARFTNMRQTIALPLTSGGEWVWEFCNPNLLVCRLVSESQKLQCWFAEALERHPTLPWTLLIGFDEFVPGNKLKLHNARKKKRCASVFRSQNWEQAYSAPMRGSLPLQCGPR